MKLKNWAAVCAAALMAAACGDAAEGDVASAAEQSTAEGADGTPPAEAGAEAADAADPAAASDAAFDTGMPDDSESVRSARCRVYDPGGDYDGPCEFVQWGGPSFLVRRAGGEPFFADISEVVVEVDAPGVAGGSIRQSGELNPLGTMNRHTDDRACWSSADFTVCAY
jgi:hypothetical protein